MSVATEATQQARGDVLADRSAWLPARVVLERLGITNRVLVGLVDARRITVRQVPGAFPRYLAADVERILAESIIPASA